MKPGTMYGNGRNRFTLVKIAIAGGGERLDVWDVADLVTGAVRQLDEDEIFAADELPAQVGQAWIDDDCLVTLTRCQRVNHGSGRGWEWLVAEADGAERWINEAALFAYYARVDGIDAAAATRPAAG